MEDVPEYKPFKNDSTLFERFKVPSLAYLTGTATSYLLQFGLKSHNGVTDDLSAPDNLLNAAAVVIPYTLIKPSAKRLSNSDNCIAKWAGEKLDKYAGLLAILPAVAYELVENITSKGIFSNSHPTPMGTVKDIISYATTGVILYCLDNCKFSKNTDDPASPTPNLLSTNDTYSLV